MGRNNRLETTCQTMNHVFDTKEQDGPLIVPVKIRFDDTYQFSEGSANASVTRFAELSENSEVF